MENYNILKTGARKLSPSDLQIVEAINSDPYKFISMGIIEYAKFIYTSKSCITRLVEKLGFKSLFEMKLFIQKELTKRDFSYNLTDNSTLLSRIQNLRAYNNYAINETLTYLKLEEFGNVCKKIVKAQRLLFFGVSSSYLAANELANNLQRIGVNATATNDIHNAILKVATFSGHDIIITFCKSGATKEVVFLNEITKVMHATTIMITSKEGQLAHVDHVILLKDIQKQHRMIATSSKISQIVIADAIFFEVNRLINNDRVNQQALAFLELWKQSK